MDKEGKKDKRFAFAFLYSKNSKIVKKKKKKPFWATFSEILRVPFLKISIPKGRKDQVMKRNAVLYTFYSHRNPSILIPSARGMHWQSKV